MYNIYVENSASMDGYVNGPTQFKETVYSFLAKINLPSDSLADSMNLFYINSRAIPFHDSSTINQMALEDFIKRLNPTTFQLRGGDRGKTDLCTIVDSILAPVDTGHVSILISDCIFSPGRQDANTFLINQKIGLTNRFNSKLCSLRDMTTIIIKQMSTFKGKYFDMLDRPRQVDNPRPYYIILIGPRRHLDTLFSRTAIHDMAEYRDRYVFSSQSSSPPDYRILQQMSIGEFDLDRDDPQLKTICNVRPSNRPEHDGVFQFAIGANLTSKIEDSAYLHDPRNYIVPANYQLDITAPDPDPAAEGPTIIYVLRSDSNRAQTEELSLRLRKLPPQWVDGVNIDNDTTAEYWMTADRHPRTFGLRYFADGIAEAYRSFDRPKGADSEYLFTFTIKVRR